MAEVTVSQFAETLKVPVDRLLTQLDEAGIPVKDPSDTINDDSKMKLLTHLRRSHGRKEENVTATPRKITLKRKSQSELRLSGAQGRSRTVNVEVRKKRTYIKRDVLEEKARAQQEELDRQRAAEQEAQEAKEREIEERRRQAEAETRQREEEEAQRKADEEARKQAEEQARLAAEEELKRKEAEARAAREKREAAAKPAKPAGKARPGRKQLHIAGPKSGRRKRTKPVRRRPSAVNVSTQHGFQAPSAPVVREVSIPETITVSELAQKMAVKASEVIKLLFGMGEMVTINQTIDQDTAKLVVEEMGHTAKLLKENQLEEEILEAGQPSGDALPRPPVITIMGHVDHGKTSLLDHIRSTRVTAGEAGGITQHIGAYSVTTDNGIITFLDTPGHAAFTAMRARGAQVTDIVVLVVAADDGVMPQTVEAIEHSKAAGVPVVVAINKIDKADADPDRVKNELSAHEIIPEDWGGENIFVNVSAITGEGIDSLLDALLLQAEVLELKAPEDGPASGVVVESSLEKGRGAVATVLVNSGTLRVGEVLLAGQEYGRVRAMFDETGTSIEAAGPSMPAMVLGLSGTPEAGDDFLVLESERKAREVASFREAKEREGRLVRLQKDTRQKLIQEMSGTDASVINLVIKADVRGSAEALRESLTKLSNDEVNVVVLSDGVGGITESDANLASASEAMIIGFNVRADGAARNALKESGVELRYYSVIYEAIDDVKQLISGMLAPEVKEQIVGLAEVREVFRSPKLGAIAGCMVTEGYVRRNLPIRVLRDNVVIFEGELESLRRFKDDVNEVRAGTECGIGVKSYNDVREGDQIECYERVEVARSL